MSQLLYDEVKDPSGKSYRVSTIRTVGGGAPDVPAIWTPFGIKLSDFDNYMAWPFETMVFELGSSVGLYHAPYPDEQSARNGHEKVVEAIKLGSEWAGGVEGADGTPSIKPEDWLREHAVNR